MVCPIWGFRTWRDVQHLVVKTALRCNKEDAGWHRNHAGLWFNLKYGFGTIATSTLFLDHFSRIGKAKL